MWPADRAWLVATDIDLPWTGIAGSARLIVAWWPRTALDARARRAIRPTAALLAHPGRASTTTPSFTP